MEMDGVLPIYDTISSGLSPIKPLKKKPIEGVVVAGMSIKDQENFINKPPMSQLDMLLQGKGVANQQTAKTESR